MMTNVGARPAAARNHGIAHAGAEGVAQAEHVTNKNLYREGNRR
jgi:hypothetical protein